MNPDNRRRRAFLSGVVGALAGLAGCEDGGSADRRTDASTPTSSPRPTESADGRPTATPTASPTATTTSNADEPTETAGPTTVEFDGGGAAAFADALATAAASPGSTLRIVDGPHRLGAAAAPDGDVRTHFAVADARGLTIDGTGAALVLTDPTRGFLSVADSEDVTVRNLTVDYDPLPFTQAAIESWDPEARELVVRCRAGFPALDARAFETASLVQATVHERSGASLRRVDGHGGAFKRFASIARLGDRRFELTLADGIGAAGLAEGRLLAVAARRSSTKAIRFRRCGNPTVERVTLRTAPGYAVYFDYCAGPTARGVSIAPPPESERVIAGCSDGVHLDNCRAGPLVEGCRFDRIEDDAVVVDTQLVEVVEAVDDRTVRVAPSVGSLVATGDRMTASSPAFDRKGTLPEVTRIDQQGGSWTEGPALPELIEFADAVDGTLAAGDYLSARAFANEGFVVRDNAVRHGNARCVRVGGGIDGVVAENDLRGTNNDAILVEANGGGTPKRWVDGLTIRDNTLQSVGLVSVASGRPEGIVVNVDAAPVYDRSAPGTGRPHRNVRIENNVVEGCATTGVHVADVTGATVSGNRVTDPGRIPVTAFDAYGFGVDNAADVTLRNNAVVGTNDDVDGFGWRTASEGVRTSGNSLVVGGTERTARVSTVAER